VPSDADNIIVLQYF